MLDPTAGTAPGEVFRAAALDPDPQEQLQAFGDFFADGCRDGAVAPLPAHATDAASFLPSAERVAAVRERLERLGYDPGKATALDSRLDAALRAFQSGAGLPDHGILDVVTWDALQALFNFEAPLQAVHWFDEAGEPRAALRRAAQLRLSVFGFGDPPDPRGPVVPELGTQLVAFAAAAADLGAADLNEPDENNGQLTPARADLLFDHERLIGRLAAVTSGLVAALPRKRREAAETLLICAAKIELWLFGYEVRPDGDPGLGRRARRGRPGNPPPLRRFEETRTATEMRRFLADIEPAAARVPLPRLASELPRLFQQTLVLRARAAQTPHEEASHEIVDALVVQLEREPALLGRLMARAAALVGRLFDGVRRVVAWVGRLLRTAARVVFEQAANLWRVVYHFSGLVAFRLGQAIGALAAGVSFLFSPRQDSEPPGHALCARRMDFDLSLVVEAGADGEVVRAFGRNLARRSARFAVACRIVALAVRAVKRVVARTALGPAGYASLVLGLARAYADVRELGRMLAALDEA